MIPTVGDILSPANLSATASYVIRPPDRLHRARGLSHGMQNNIKSQSTTRFNEAACELNETPRPIADAIGQPRLSVPV
jgi:hypothetical protein